MANKSDPLRDKVSDWLTKEGYPLEFRVANAFRSAGFSVRQGQYARSEDFESPREIDVSASVTETLGKSLVRAYHVVECKWSQDKPWVIFSDRSHLHRNAMVAQAISSKVGQSVLWIKAGSPALHGLDCFSSAERSGFGGRQAFGNGIDQFYAATQSIVEKAVAIAKHYDSPEIHPSQSMYCAVVFPVVVVSAPLFEAYYSQESERIELVDVDRIRVLWRGADKWSLHAMVDIVRESSLEQFCAERAHDMEILLAEMAQCVRELQECFESKSAKPLNLDKGPRGISGMPYVLQKLDLHIKASRPRRSRNSVR